jgi:hypothetical protein
VIVLEKLVWWVSYKKQEVLTWFSTDTPVSSTNNTDHHDIPTAILWKVAVNTTTLAHSYIIM